MSLWFSDGGFYGAPEETEWTEVPSTRVMAGVIAQCGAPIGATASGALVYRAPRDIEVPLTPWRWAAGTLLDAAGYAVADGLGQRATVYRSWSALGDSAERLGRDRVYRPNCEWLPCAPLAGLDASASARAFAVADIAARLQAAREAAHAAGDIDAACEIYDASLLAAWRADGALGRCPVSVRARMAAYDRLGAAERGETIFAAPASQPTPAATATTNSATTNSTTMSAAFAAARRKYAQ